jgi:hypothetical protein
MESRVREEEDFEEAYMSLDSVKLWELIRRTHLTHTFGDGDPMREVNILEQETRFAALRQGGGNISQHSNCVSTTK